jgi:hypothetical protein
MEGEQLSDNNTHHQLPSQYHMLQVEINLDTDLDVLDNIWFQDAVQGGRKLKSWHRVDQVFPSALEDQLHIVVQHSESTSTYIRIAIKLIHILQSHLSSPSHVSMVMISPKPALTG